MKKRGPTVMPKIVKGTSKRKKFQVNFNYKGQPIGKMRPKVSSMVRVWSRSLVPIMYTTWKKVPTEIKNKLWACVMHIDEPELLRHPPTGQEWGSIPQENWNQFVEFRKSIKFK
ncbi:hypothetical protein CISIN_1g046613mg, partial [Citrus sinensis]